MDKMINRFVLQGEIDDATARHLHEIALQKGLRAASYAVSSLTEFSDLPPQYFASSAAESNPEQVSRADRHQFKAYAQTIGFNLPTMGSVWSMMVSEAYENPENHRFQFQNIPTRRARYPSEPDSMKPLPDEATGLNVTLLFDWVTEMQSELQDRELQMTKSAFAHYIARSTGSLSRFKLLANFAYSEMGKLVPYDPKTFSMTGRKEKSLAIEQTAQRLQAGYIPNAEHPLIEQVEIFVENDSPLQIVPGISLDNMGAVIAQHKEDLGISDVNRSLSAAFVNYDSLRGHAITQSTGASAYSIEGLVSSLQISSVRSKEILCTLLGEILIEDPDKQMPPPTHK